MRKNYIQYYRDRAHKRKAAAIIALGGKCVKCGMQDTRTLDFDHIDPKTKISSIHLMFNAAEWRFQEELAKCQLLCANCHRIKTVENKDTQNREHTITKPRPILVYIQDETWYNCPGCDGQFQRVHGNRIYCCSGCQKRYYRRKSYVPRPRGYKKSQHLRWTQVHECTNITFREQE